MLSQLRSQPGIYHSFTAVSAFFSAELEHKQIQRSQLKSSSIHQILNFEKSTQKGPSKTVGGKKLFAKHYSKEKTNDFSKEQCSVVIVLNRKKKTGNNRNNNRQYEYENKTISSTVISNEDISTIAEIIVAGVTRASNINECHDESTSSAKYNSKNNTVEVGSVGSFIAK